MSIPPKPIGHQTHFPSTLVGLFRRACFEIPEIVGATGMGLIGLCLAGAGLYNHAKNDGDNRTYKKMLIVMRPDDPRVSRIKEPVHTKYP